MHTVKKCESKAQLVSHQVELNWLENQKIWLQWVSE